MKKAFVITPFFPMPALQRETEDYFLIPGQVLATKGCEVEFLTLLPSGSKRIELGKGVGTKAEDSFRGFKIRRFPSTFSLLSYVRKHKNSIIHTNLRPFPPSLLAGFLGNPKVHTAISYELGSNFLIKQLSIFLLKRFDFVIPITPYEKGILKKAGLKEKRLRWIPLPLDYKFFSKKVPSDKSMEKFGLKKGDYVISTVANIRRFKRIDILIDAFVELKKDVKNAVLVVAGDDWLEREGFPSVRKTAEYRGVSDSVITTGYLNSNGVRNLLSLTDLFVNTSSVESQCVAVYEAAAQGIPLCLSNIGSFTSVFGNNALYHEHTDSRKLAQNIMKYYKDKKLVKKNTKNLKKLMPEWDHIIIKKKLSDIYDSLIVE